MINFNKEYFNNNCYFFLKDKGDKISLYYSVADTLTESRKTDNKMDFKKKDSKNVKNIINKFLNSKKKTTKKEIDKELKNVKTGEIDELIDSDGGLLSARTPYLNQALHPRKTMDQTVTMTRFANDPITRGYRVYYGESEDKGDEVVSEIDLEKAFGWEETQDKDYVNTVKILKDMGVENSEERAQEFGKLPKQKVKKDRKGRPVLKQRLSEKDSIEEQEKQKMIKMVEDILSKKSKDNSDVVKRETENSSVSKILVKNLQSIKKLADKEGISINKLISILKTSE
jgi:hypothetical protein